jgi:hypothetical protein
MFLSTLENTDADIHLVTHLITSLLGLIVFPYAEIKKRKNYNFFAKYKLQSLSQQGWPSWSFGISSSDNLRDLVRHLRNALSHRLIYFSSDSRKPEDVIVTFRDRKNENSPYTWEATINAAELRQFVLRFADLLKTWEQDYS